MAPNAGSAEVTIAPSLRGLGAAIRKEIAKEIGGAGLDQLFEEHLKKPIKVPVQPDPTGFEDLPKRLPKPPKVPVELDPLVKAFQADIQRQMRQLAKQVDAKIPVSAETRGLRAALGKEILEVQRQTRLRIPTEPAEKREYEAKVKALADLVSARVTARIPVDVDKGDVVKKTVAATKAAQAAAGRVRIGVDVDRRSITAAGRVLDALIRSQVSDLRARTLSLLGGIAPAIRNLFTKGLSGLAKASGITVAVGAAATAVAGLAAAAASAIPVLVGLGAALATAAGAAAAIPGAVAIAGAAVTTLKLGLGGLDDAFKAVAKGDAAALAEVLKKLAPNAQAFVREVAKIKPAFDKMRLDVQNRLFAGTAAVLKSLSANLLPTAAAGFGRLAEVINQSVVGAVTALNTAGTRSVLATVFASAATAAGNLAVALAPVGRALLSVVAVGAEVTAQLTAGVGAAISQIADRVNGLAQSGALRQMILDGVEVFKQFAGLAKDVLGIFGGIAKAAGGSGGGLFDFFDRLNAAINSSVGQGALKQIFAELANIGAALTPVILTLLRALGPLAGAIARIAEAFAPGLQQVVQAIGAGLASLAPVVVGLAPALTAVADAVTPLASVFGQLVAAFTPGLVSLVGGLSDALSVLATGWAGVATGIAAVEEEGQGLSSVLGPTATVGKALADVAAALAPALAQVARIIAGLIVGLGPGVQAFLGGLTEGLSVLAPLASTIGSALGSVLSAVGTALAPLAVILADLVTNLAPGVTAFIEAFAAGLAALSPAAAPVGRALADIFAALAPLLPLLGSVLTDALTVLAGLLSQVSLQFGPLVAVISEGLTGAITTLLPPLLELVESTLPIAAQVGLALAQAFLPLVPVFAQIAQIIAEQLMVFLPQFTAAAQQLAPVVAQVAEVLAGHMLFAFQQLVPMLPSLVQAGLELVLALQQLVIAVAPLLPAFLQVAVLVAQLVIKSGALRAILILVLGAVVIVTGAIQAATAVFRVIAGAVTGAISAFTSFASGVVAAIGRALDAIRSVPGAIKSAIGNLGSLLFSAGASIIDGLADGIRSAIGRAVAAAEAAVARIPGPVRKVLGISSPSKVFAAIGREIPAGLAVGITGNTAAATAAVTRMATASVGAFSGFSAAPVPAPAIPAQGTGRHETLHIDHFHARGTDPSDLAVELDWLARRGG